MRSHSEAESRISQGISGVSAAGLLAELVLLALIAGFGFLVNRDIVIKGLYMDDLYMWSCYGEQGLLEFAFPIGTSTRFRPVYWLATYLQMMIVGTDMTRFVTFNVVINIAVAWGIYYMARRLSESRLAAFTASLCFLASRFAYYQIGQALGLMETMAMALALFILYRLYVFMSEEIPGALPPPDAHSGHRGRSRRKDPGGAGYYAALFAYFLLAFTHERYISLLPLFYLVLILRTAGSARGQRSAVFRGDVMKWIAPAVVLAIIILIRTFAIGKALPAGTGGTEVTDTFSLGECVSYALSQVYYIFGVNAGPEHLNGLPWEQTPPEIRRMVKYSVLLAGLLVILYLVCVLRAAAAEASGGRKERPVLYRELSACLLFGGFIGLNIACSSVTIRVEMRWIYVSYAAALLFASYMIGSVRRNAAENAARVLYAAAVALFIVYGILSVKTNIFYRGYFDRLYFWPNQLRMNSLAEQTVEKYGTDGVFGKDIYILENSYGMSDFYGRTFFKTYDPEKKAEGTRVIFAEGPADVDTAAVAAGRALVLEEVPEENAYRDVTESFKEAPLNEPAS